MNRNQTFKNNKKTLFLVATPIGNLGEFSPRAIETLNSVDAILCEDTRTSKLLLDKFDIKKNLIAYHKFNEKEMCDKVTEHLNNGQDIALISDAGYPGISDPGEVLVKEVISHGFNVTCINGSNALLPALVCSGLSTSSFLFYGFLDSKEVAKKKELKMLETIGATVIFYESPNRVEETIKCIYEVLGDRQVSIGRELTKQFEEFIRGSAKELANEKLDIKGECVIVVEGCKAKEDTIDEELISMVKDLQSHGYSLKDACAFICKLKNVNKNELYNTIVKKGL